MWAHNRCCWRAHRSLLAGLDTLVLEPQESLGVVVEDLVDVRSRQARLEVVDDGKAGEFLQDTWHRLAVPHLHRPRALERRQCGVDLPALAVPHSEVGNTGTLCVEERGHQGDLAAPEARRADMVAHLSE